MAIKVSAWDLTAGFIRLMYNKDIPESEKDNILNRFCVILNNGYTYEKIAETIRNCFVSKNVDALNKIFMNEYKGFDKNIIKQENLFVMPWLNIIMEPPKMLDDFEKGVYCHILETERFYSEPIASMTMDQLVDIYYEKIYFNKDEYDRKRITGFLNYIVKKYGPEITLFMIYVGVGTQEDNMKPMSIQDFENLHDAAVDCYNWTVNCRITEEVFYIVPKQRVLFN